jgi:hypothetical protein
MRIPMVGVGAVSCHFGELLAHAGEDVGLITREARLRTIRSRGLQIGDLRDKIRRQFGASDWRPIKRGAGRHYPGGCQGVANRGSVRTLRPLMRESTLAVTLIDGVEAPCQFAEVFSTRRVAAERRARGEIVFQSRRTTFPRLHQFRPL